MYLRILIIILLAFAIESCKEDSEIDLIIKNANIYAVDTTYAADAIAISNNKIFKIGYWKDLKSEINDSTKVIDAQGHFVMPGFIEGHGHYAGLGYSMINLNFLLAKSWEEVVSNVATKVNETPKGVWIIGRGWHQEKWDSIPKQQMYNYPFHYSLSAVSPNNPVVLYHASGHALFANKKAMDIVGISKETPNPVGGEILRDSNGDAIGVFEERAMRMFQDKYDAYVASLDKEILDSIWYSAIVKAEDECLKKGITSFQDAGSTFDELDKYEKLANEGKMRVRLWAMLRESADKMVERAATYKKINVGGNHFFTCNAIKSEVDGALGAFGAWLIEPYSDKPGFKGQNTTDIYEVKKIADIAMKNDMQFCVHAIGDRANRVVLDIYEGLMAQQKEQKDLRWRIEHAQVVDPFDQKFFSGMIPSIQPTHATSDMYWAEDRVGEERIKTAYAYKKLLNERGMIAAGSDFPVEAINPLFGFYAAVSRKDQNNFPENGFQIENALTREEALKAMTIWAAYAGFEESYRGSLEKGKDADFVILEKDLMQADEKELFKIKVLQTHIAGERVF